MGLKAEAFQPRRDPLMSVEDVVPLVIPMSMWDVLVCQSKIEGCAPGEVLDKALRDYLEANDGERLTRLRARMEQERG